MLGANFASFRIGWSGSTALQPVFDSWVLIKFECLRGLIEYVQTFNPWETSDINYRELCAADIGGCMEASFKHL